jgi:CRISP-associated protein Cas1
MLNRILEIQSNDRLLCVQRGSLSITDSKTKKNITYIPFDDLDGIIVSGYAIWQSATLLARLAELGIMLVVTNQLYRPVAILIGVDNNVLQGQRMIAQHDATLSVNKRLWQEIIQQKLNTQANLLNYYKNYMANSVKLLVKNVKSGDPSNLEAQGARYYWQGFMSDIKPEFRRDQSAADDINIALNYGYTVLRIAIAKNILAAGLHTGWGIHHCHPNNTMPLADDLMEPFRPMIDAKIHALCKANLLGINNNVEAGGLSAVVRKSLVDTVYTDVCMMGENKPFMSYLQTLIISLVRVYMDEGKFLAFPEVKKIDWSDYEVIHKA